MKNGKMNRRLGKLLSAISKGEKKLTEAGKNLQKAADAFRKNEAAVKALIGKVAGDKSEKPDKSKSEKPAKSKKGSGKKSEPKAE